MDLEEYVRRFYHVCLSLVPWFGGELVKFTGDGFLAVWPLSSEDVRANHRLCTRVNLLAQTLGVMVRVTDLDLPMEKSLTLRMGVTIEPAALKVRYRKDGVSDWDYIGKMINFAFRIQALAQFAPYVVAHKHYVDLLNKYPPEDGLRSDYRQRSLTDDEVSKFFKGVREQTDQVFAWQYSEDDGLIESIKKDLHKPIGPIEMEQARQELSVVRETGKSNIPENVLDYSPGEDSPEWLNECLRMVSEFVRRQLSLMFELKQLKKHSE